MLDYDKPVSETVYEAVCDTLGVEAESLSDDTKLVDDLGAESVNYVHIGKSIEKTYDITVPFMQLRRRKTIGAIIEYINELREE